MPDDDLLPPWIPKIARSMYQTTKELAESPFKAAQQTVLPPFIQRPLDITNRIGEMYATTPGADLFGMAKVVSRSFMPKLAERMAKRYGFDMVKNPEEIEKLLQANKGRIISSKDLGGGKREIMYESGLIEVRQINEPIPIRGK